VLLEGAVQGGGVVVFFFGEFLLLFDVPVGIGTGFPETD